MSLSIASMTSDRHQHEVLIESVENEMKIGEALAGIMRCAVPEAIEALQNLPLRVVLTDENLDLGVAALTAAGGKVTVVSARAPEHSFEKFFARYRSGLIATLNELDMQAVSDLADDLTAARARRGWIYLIGNGGSAATASHMATDLAKDRFGDPSLLFKVQSLSDNAALVTATGNDSGYDRLFVSQLERVLEPNDLVIAISSSGNSPNVVKAVEYARSRGVKTWGLSGFDGGQLRLSAERCVHIPTKKGHYGFHEDVTSILNHMLTIFIYEQDRARHCS